VSNNKIQPTMQGVDELINTYPQTYPQILGISFLLLCR